MASPTVVGTPSESAEATQVTTHTINRPAGVAGQLTIVIFGWDTASALTWNGSYTQFFTIGRADAAFSVAGAYRWEDGTETTTFTNTTAATRKSATLLYSISGAINPATQVPQATTVDGTVATLNPNPPAITPTGGSKDYLFIAGFVQDGEVADVDGWATAAPTNYTNMLQKTSGTGGVATTNVVHASAQRALTASTDDPATFTSTLNVTYLGYTIAVHPAAAAAAGIPQLAQRSRTRTQFRRPNVITGR